ncbi:hemerythrin domain-containing protein [Candidatus Nitrospira bockiana]
MPDPKKQRAGRKGGQTVSKNRAHMAAIGRKGGQQSRVKRAAKKQEAAAQEPMPQKEVAEQATGLPASENGDQTARVGKDHAVELLKADHARVHSLYEDYETAGGQDKQNIAEKIMRELEVHAAIEEEIFYPAFREKTQKEGRDLVAEALEEHKAVKAAIRELREMDPDDEAFEGRFHDMMQDVEHHVGEEEGEMLPMAEEALGERLEELGADMQKRKQELIENFTTGAAH